MAEEKVSELRECPFCNKPAHVEYPDTARHMMEIGCPDNWNFKRGLQGRCNVAPAATGYTYAETAERWNRRTTTPVTEDVGDRVLVPRDKLQLASDLLNLYRAQAGWRELAAEFAALSASPSPPKADGPGVKPLEWGKTSYGAPEAFTIVGVYRIISAYNGGWTVTVGGLSGRILKDDDGRENFATVDAAKAAAQSDCEARILSALVSPSIKREA